MKSLVKEPVKQAVKEALAEERALADDQDRDRTEIKEVRRRRPKQMDYDTDHREYDRVQYDTEEDKSGSRILKPALLLMVLGVVAVAVMKRQKLKEAVKSDESGTSTVSNQRSTTHADSVGTHESTSHMGEGDTDSRSTQPKEYDVDTDDGGLSTRDDDSGLSTRDS